MSSTYVCHIKDNKQNYCTVLVDWDGSKLRTFISHLVTKCYHTYRSVEGPLPKAKVPDVTLI